MCATKKEKTSTFAEKKVNKSQLTQLEKDRKLMKKYLHKRLRYSITTGQPMGTLAQQYIELPLAIACNDGTPVRGQKSNSTKALQSRYQSAVPQVFKTGLHNWTPDCCILEGMFMINTNSLGSHKTFGDYGQFLIQIHLLSRGTTEVHVIFYQYGAHLITPKQFEQRRRDKQAKISIGHTCDEIKTQTKIPPHWRENVINCRNFKYNLIQFLAVFFLQRIQPYLAPNKALVVAGAFDGDEAWQVCGQGPSQPNPTLKSNAEETD